MSFLLRGFGHQNRLLQALRFTLVGFKLFLKQIWSIFRKKQLILVIFSHPGRFWSCLLSCGMRFYQEEPKNRQKTKKCQKFQKFAKSDQFLDLSSDSDAARREDFCSLNIVLVGPHLSDFQTCFLPKRADDRA